VQTKIKQITVLFFFNKLFQLFSLGIQGKRFAVKNKALQQIQT